MLSKTDRDTAEEIWSLLTSLGYTGIVTPGGIAHSFEEWQAKGINVASRRGTFFRIDEGVHSSFEPCVKRIGGKGTDAGTVLNSWQITKG